jgi:hypothetical protein
VPRLRIQADQELQASLEIRVPGGQHPFSYLESPLEETLGGGQVALVLKQEGQVFEAGGGVRVIGPQQILANGERPLEAVSGALQVALVLQLQADAGEIGGSVGLGHATYLLA